MASLQSLPLEIQLMICRAVAANDDTTGDAPSQNIVALASLARTCRVLDRAATEILYGGKDWNPAVLAAPQIKALFYAARTGNEGTITRLCRVKVSRYTARLRRELAFEALEAKRRQSFNRRCDKPMWWHIYPPGKRAAVAAQGTLTCWEAALQMALDNDYMRIAKRIVVNTPLMEVVFPQSAEQYQIL
ncbi:hypothetical protein ACHAQA_005947 [Verticillium albo-atrum]